MTRIAFRSSWAAFFFFLLAISVEAKRCIQFPTIAPPQNILQPAVLPHAQQSLLGQSCRLPSTPNGPSSCGLGLYCSIYTLTCLPQRDTGSPCRSSTQCLSGSCEHTTCSSRPPPSSHHALLLTKRDNGQNFSTVHDHSTAFNVIHLIIVIVGIAMASIVGLVAFVLFRRRRKANNSDLEKAAMQSTQRFNAFQQVFFLDSSADDNIRPAETARLRTSDQTPLMQQQQLHWQLLEQQRRKAPLPQQQQDFVAPPPPPYHP